MNNQHWETNLIFSEPKSHIQAQVIERTAAAFEQFMETSNAISCNMDAQLESSLEGKREEPIESAMNNIVCHDDDYVLPSRKLEPLEVLEPKEEVVPLEGILAQVGQSFAKPRLFAKSRDVDPKP